MTSVDRRIVGVGFNADARVAGSRTWLADAETQRRRLVITACRPLAEIRLGVKARDEALPALCHVLGRAEDAVIGLDFAFGIPAAFVRDTTWEAFVGFFPSRFPTADGFRRACLRADRGRGLQRVTDEVAQTPGPLYPVRRFRQTWAGIGRVLHPLVRDDRVRVLPMQAADPAKPILIEVCPPATLGARGKGPAYQGTGPAARDVRIGILERLATTSTLALSGPSIRDRVVADDAGDALHAILAAVTAAAAARRGFTLMTTRPVRPKVEGWVYA